MAVMPLLLTDDDVADGVDAPMAVEAMRHAIRAAYAGDLVAPPRVFADLGSGRLAVTAGGLADQWYGFRSYDTFGLPDGDQLVVLHDAKTGQVRAIAVGEELGARRTGAIGGVAVDALARPEAATRHADRIAALGAVLVGDVPGRRSREDITLFCSVGLAGTEVFLLDRLTGRLGKVGGALAGLGDQLAGSDKELRKLLP